jgi:NAD(P)-dependent dehydrogenase (short-subunit alcohol dehydrogenase family)
MEDHSTPSSGRVAGKVALVTGAGSGIGRATAVLLARHGAVIYCADIDQPAAEQTASTIVAENGRAQPCLLDVTSEPAWCAATDRVLAEQGRLDVLVNCAGIASTCPIEDLRLEDWRRVLAVNLEGVFLGTKHAVRAMRRQPSGGSIVNVASVSGVKAQPTASAYCASKAAVIMLTKTVALECLRNKDNIRVNAVSPSGVKTPMWKTMPFFQDLMAREGSEEAAFRAMVRDAPQGRFAEPEEIALAILYLASDESLFVTGTNLMIDNGDTA